MATRALQSSPRILPLYVRAAAPMIPGASLLPFVPGGGKEIPPLELSLAGVTAEPAAVAAYARVCGFALRDTLPATYPHVLAFPLHMAVMADGSFPFGAVGLVHVENRIAQHRPVHLGEALDLLVRPTPLEPHPHGRTFSLVTEARVGEELVWESTSTFLRRGKAPQPADGDKATKDVPSAASTPTPTPSPDPEEFRAAAEWRLPGDLGRRYAAVSGDRNPIHMHSLSAKPLGFPGAIAHGMWTKARCLAALDAGLPGAFEVEVRFRKPILLPAKVEFGEREAPDGATEFAVRDARKQTPHLDGRLRPLEQTEKAKKGK